MDMKKVLLIGGGLLIAGIVLKKVIQNKKTEKIEEKEPPIRPIQPIPRTTIQPIPRTRIVAKLIGRPMSIHRRY